MIPSRISVSVSSSPSRSEPPVGPGRRARSEQLEPLLSELASLSAHAPRPSRETGVALCSSRTRALLGRAAVYERGSPNTSFIAQLSLAAVDHEQDRRSRSSPVDEVSQQRRASVAFSVTLPTPRYFDALSRDPERDDIGSQRSPARRASSPRAHISQRTAHQLTQRSPMRSMNISDTVLFLVEVDSCSTSSPTSSPTTANCCRDASEHPVHHRPCELSQSSKYS